MEEALEGNMDEKQTAYFTVLDKKSRSKFICFTRRKNGIFCVCLTNTADVWSTEYTEDTLNQFRQRFSLKSTEDYVLKLRSACVSGDVSVVVHHTGAELHVGPSPGDMSVTLFRQEGPQATEELKDLLFRMAERLSQLDIRPPCISPVKNQPRHPIGTQRKFDPAKLSRCSHMWLLEGRLSLVTIKFKPRQQQNCAPLVTVKRRLPGASLINPGTKKKLQATGVAFDDADEDED